MILAGFRAMELISTRLEYKLAYTDLSQWIAVKLISTRLEYKFGIGSNGGSLA